MFFNDLVSAIKAYGEALKYLSRLGLWGYFFIPAFIALGLVVVFGTLAFSFSDNLAGLALYFIPDSWETSWLGAALAVVNGILVFALGILLLRYLVIILSAPFMGPMTAKIEKNINGQLDLNQALRSGEWLSDLLRSLRINLRNLTKEMLFTLPLLLLGFIPGLAIVTVPLVFLIQAHYAGFGNLDYTLERHFNVPESVRFVKQHRGLSIGNGAIFILLLLTGVGFLVAVPWSAAAATISCARRLGSRPAAEFV